MITNLGTLKTALTFYSKRTELSTTDLDQMVGLFEARLNGAFVLGDGRTVRIRTQPMEATPATGTLTANNPVALTLPATFLETRTFSVTIGGIERELEFWTLEQTPGAFVAAAPPIRFGYVNGALNVYPTPDFAYPYTHRFYEKITPIAGVSASASNSIITAFPHLYLFGTLVEIAQYCRDYDKLEGYNVRFEQAVLECTSTDTGIRFPKAPRMDFPPELKGWYGTGTIESGFQ